MNTILLGVLGFVVVLVASIACFLRSAGARHRKAASELAK